MQIDLQHLSNPDLARDLYNRYYLHEGTPDSILSSHWNELSRRINVFIDQAGNLITFRGYGFGDLEPTHIINRTLKYLCNFSYFLRSSQKSDLLFLIKRARPLIRRMNSFLSYDCFRQLSSLAIIKRYLRPENQEALDILIIGDGYGFLSAALKDLYPGAKITLVDIGKVLFFQAVNLQRVFPGLSHSLFGAAENAQRTDFLYIPAEAIWKVKPAKYKLIINIASMQEMNYETIEGYFKFIRSNAREDNLFYCCNRQQKSLIGGEVIKFANYPWQKQDWHFIDQVCPFYKYHLSIRFPFFHRLDGIFMHRLSNLKPILQG